MFHQLENVITDSVWLKSYLSGGADETDGVLRAEGGED